MTPSAILHALAGSPRMDGVEDAPARCAICAEEAPRTAHSPSSSQCGAGCVAARLVDVARCMGAHRRARPALSPDVRLRDPRAHPAHAR
jgi:hypothetical protein